MPYSYYAVHRGRKPGVYRTYKECLQQVEGFSKPVFKGFDDLASAIAFWRTGEATPATQVSESGQPPPNAVTIRHDGREAELPLEEALEEALRQLKLIPLPD